MKTHSLYLASLLVALSAGSVDAQISVTNTEILDTPADGMWGYARFSPDGKSLFFTSLSYTGIWRYDLATHAASQLVTEDGAGFAFSISPDGRHLAYRRTLRGARWIDRTQEIVVKELASGSSEVVASARTLSPPAFHDDAVTYVQDDGLLPTPPKRTGVFLQGIVDQKIMLVVNGVSRSIDPLGNGSYIWPSLSPDRTQVLAYDMDNGAIISSIDGTLLQRLGRAEAPSWTRDGEWVVYFSENNDGYRITGGELHAVRKDGSDETDLTRTPSRVELFPSCSPTEDRIVSHTMDGKLLIMTYTVAP